MTSINIKANGSVIASKLSGKITSGMVGIDVHIECDDQWAGLNKTAFFRSGDFVRKREAVGVYTTVPWEVLRKHGKTLDIGLEGRDADGNIVMPTVWSTIGTIFQGAQGDVPAAPNPGSGNGENVGGAVIDDSQASLSTTWSSKKIGDMFDRTAEGAQSNLENAMHEVWHDLGLKVETVNGISPDENGNVEIPTGGGSAEGAVLYTPQTPTPEEKAQARANIFPEQVNDILNYDGESVALPFRQYGNYRLAADLTEKIPENCLLTWNDTDYSACAVFRDAEDKSLKDSGWNLPSPIDVASLYSGEYAIIRVIVAKGKPNIDGGRNAISLETDLPLANVLLSGEPKNDLKQVIEDVANLADDVDTLKDKVAEIEAKPDPVVIGNQSGITLIAHGGYTNIYPENTLISLYGAKKYGFSISGCDLRVTADGHFVLMHDATVDRTTNGTGNVADMTLEQIKALNIDLWAAGTTGEEWAGLKVPTLEEYLEDCIKYNIIPMLEARDFTESQLDDLVAILRKYNLEDVAIIESFYPATCTYLRSISKVQLAPLIAFTTENVDYCKALGNAYININASSENPSEEMMAYAIKKGVEVIAWTVNAIDRARALEQLGVKYIITDKLIYANKIENAYITQHYAFADNLDGTVDNWGFVIYKTGLEGVQYKDLARVRAEIFYTQDKPVLGAGGLTYALQDKPNEWQTVDFLTYLVDGGANLSMKNKNGLAYVKNASIAIMKV